MNLFILKLYEKITKEKENKELKILSYYHERIYK